MKPEAAHACFVPQLLGMAQTWDTLAQRPRHDELVGTNRKPFFFDNRTNGRTRFSFVPLPKIERTAFFIRSL